MYDNKVTLSLYYKFLELSSSPTTQENACIYSIVHGPINSIIQLQQQSRSFHFPRMSVLQFSRSEYLLTLQTNIEQNHRRIFPSLLRLEKNTVLITTIWAFLRRSR